MRMISIAVAVAVVLLAPRANAANCGGTTQCGCGDTVTSNRTLSTDPVVSATCTTEYGLRVAAGVSLNGADLTIQGSNVTPTDLDAAGVRLDGCGATVHSLVIEGFRNGVTVQSESCTSGTPVQIALITARNNGNTSTHAGYGIKINDSDYVNLRGVTVEDAADEGVHIGTGSSFVDMQQFAAPSCSTVPNTITDSYRENLYLLGTTNNTIKHLTSTYTGACASSSCVALDIDGASSNTITASTLTGARVLLTANADNNTIGAAGAGGVTLRRVEIEAASSGAPDNNSFENITAVSSGGATCFYVSARSGNTSLTPPAGNTAVSGSLGSCSTEVRGDLFTSAPSSVNNLCAFTCSDGTCDQNDTNNVVKFTTAECP